MLSFADADPQSTAPIKYAWAVQTSTHISSGYGKHRCASLTEPKQLCVMQALGNPILSSSGVRTIYMIRHGLAAKMYLMKRFQTCEAVHEALPSYLLLTLLDICCLQKSSSKTDDYPA